MVNRLDEEHLTFAATQNRALYSFNSCDYFDIHTRWTNAGRSHSGIVAARQKRHSVGEQIRRLAKLANALSAEDMMDRIEFLSQWC